jgi:hypothetical protein
MLISGKFLFWKYPVSGTCQAHAAVSMQILNGISASRYQISLFTPLPRGLARSTHNFQQQMNMSIAPPFYLKSKKSTAMKIDFRFILLAISSLLFVLQASIQICVFVLGLIN